jgi:L-lactate dehydrogenase complex protein LldG
MSRDSILKSIKANKPQELPLKDFSLKSDNTDLVEKFSASVDSVGGKVLKYNDFVIEKLFPHARVIASKIKEFKSSIDLETASYEKLQTVDVAILKGDFAVAENAAIWLPEENMGQRVLPFIAEHLILFVEQSEIVATMHEAYRRLNNLPDYGVFISGPSKTADIEQTLVLGAQGPMSLRVVLIN